MRKWRELVEHREVVVSEKTVACDQRGRIGMCEHVTELAGGNPGIDRDHRTAERADREVSNDPFGLVAHQDRDHLALSDSKCMQPFCERSDLLAQRRIGVPLPAPYKRLSLWETCRQLVEQAGDSTARRHRNHAENALLGDRRCRAPMRIMRRARMQHQGAGIRRRRTHRCRGSTIRWSGGRVLARPAPGGTARLRMTYPGRST